MKRLCDGMDYELNGIMRLESILHGGVWDLLSSYFERNRLAKVP